jgi:hypothetical protein
MREAKCRASDQPSVDRIRRCRISPAHRPSPRRSHSSRVPFPNRLHDEEKECRKGPGNEKSQPGWALQVQDCEP